MGVETHRYLKNQDVEEGLFSANGLIARVTKCSVYTFVNSLITSYLNERGNLLKLLN